MRTRPVATMRFTRITDTQKPGSLRLLLTDANIPYSYWPMIWGIVLYP